MIFKAMGRVSPVGWEPNTSDLSKQTNKPTNKTNKTNPDNVPLTAGIVDSSGLGMTVLTGSAAALGFQRAGYGL